MYTPALHAPCGILSFNGKGVIVSCNHYCSNVLEYEEAQLEGSDFFMLLTVPGKIFYQTHFYPMLKMQHHADEIFLNLQSRNKKDIPVLLNAILHENEGEEIITCSFIPVFNRRKYEDEILEARRTAEDAFQKSEELAQLKDQLEKHQKTLDEKLTELRNQNNELRQLNDIITHDLQEPTRKLILFSTELAKEDADEERKKHAVSIITKSAQHTRQLLLNLQDYLALQVVPERIQNISLADIISGELTLLKQNYPQVQVSVTDPELPSVQADKYLLGWLFHHVLKNAFDHGTTGGQLRLHIQGIIVKDNLFNSLDERYEYADFARLTIADEGEGFDNLYHEEIFKVRKRLTPKQETLGFGLALCRRIVQLHKGKIWAHSEPGKGATFTIMLPLQWKADDTFQ